MATYLVRFTESGRELQPHRRKQRRDLAAVIGALLPGAAIAEAPGRLIVDGAPDRDVALAALPGVISVSPVRRVPRAELADAVVALARGRLDPGTSFAVRVRRAGGGANERSVDVARALGDAIHAATGARVDLRRPDVTIGVELRGDEAFVFDRVAHGIDRTGPPVPPAAGTPRFVVDQMLGRLAARLRLLGYDTLAPYDRADSELARLAAADGRILLTRDAALARSNAITVYYVAATTPRAQLAEVRAALALDPDPARYFTRCTRCNTPVEPVDEAAVHDRLPPGVRERGLRFVRCPSCARIYWRGSHVARILDELA